MISIAPPPIPPDRTIRVPGSKYIANRLLLLAALAPEASRIRGAPASEDIRAAGGALRALGVSVREEQGTIRVGGTPKAWESAENPGAPVPVDVGESGTLLRFLTALAATLPFPVRLTGRGRIPERPMGGLIRALEALGARIEGHGAQAPLTVWSPELRGGRVLVEGRESSQFASALLLASPRMQGPLELVLPEDQVSASYLELTANLMERSGIPVARTGSGFRVGSGRPHAGVHPVPADWTAASAVFGAAAITGGTIRVPGLDPDAIEGERRFPDLLEAMGARIETREDTVSVTGTGCLRGIRTSLATMPDAVPTLAVLAAFATGETRISGIGHLRHKESDRIAALESGLRTLGACVETGPDSFSIRPGPVAPKESLDSRRDHRIAMAFALAGLRVEGVRISHPDCVNKSFPEFWDTLRSLGARVSSS